MADPKTSGNSGPPKTAEELRILMLEQQMKEADKARAAMTAREKQLADFTAEFLKSQVTDHEIDMVRRLVMNAVKDGKLEAMVYSFPSELCTDSGRAITNGDAHWPDTLQGKAREFYDRFIAFGKPAGYKLKAMIINYPGGMPGDVGFFLSWEPDLS